MSEWQKVKVGDIATESKTPETNPDANRKIRVRLNVNGVEQRPLLSEKEGATKCYERKAGQFIYGRQNFHKGAFGIVPSSLDGFSSSGDLPAFDIDDSCLPEWLLYWFKTENRYMQLLKHAKGVASQRVSTLDFYSTEILLPNITTQKSIIKNLQSTEQKTKELESLFSNQKTYLTQLRQAILQEAIEGKLTADWRVKNPVQKGNPDHDAQALLETIKAEKQKLMADGKIKKEKPLAPINPDDVPFALPDGWVWVRLGEIGNAEAYPFVDGPFGSAINTKNDYIDSGISVIRMLNVKPFKFISDNLKFISFEKFQSLERHNVKANDILFSKVGAGIGEACIVPSDFEIGILSTTGVTRLRVGTIVLPKYLCLFLNTNSEKFKSLSCNTAQPFLNMTHIKTFLFSLPPLAEQNAIVERVDRLLESVNALELQVTERKSYAQQLMQAVLKEAFAG